MTEYEFEKLIETYQMRFEEAMHAVIVEESGFDPHDFIQQPTPEQDVKMAAGAIAMIRYCAHTLQDSSNDLIREIAKSTYRQVTNQK